ncbi:hypothetical protein DL768_010096 [Monosporascus sp. mg162]|nr:hypothetical protein DL768_010096 [Monosporascus sp. mg162]
MSQPDLSYPPAPYCPPKTDKSVEQDSRYRQWQIGLCDCMPFRNCVLGAFLPCFLLGKTSSRLRQPDRYPSCYNADCMVNLVLQYGFCLGCFQVYTQRAQIRERFGIEGGEMDDLCTACWCPCCALVQQDYEVVAWLSSKHKEGVPVDGQYQSQPQMQEPSLRHEPGA